MTKGRWMAAVAAAIVACATVVVGIVTSRTDAPASVAGTPRPSTAPTATPTPDTTVSYHSRHDLHAPLLTVKRSGPVGPGLLMSAPDSGHAGLLISDDTGRPVWFKPVAKGRTVGNLQVTTYRGKKVLVYFDGVGSGYYRGEWHVLNTSYQEIATIKAANGAQADIHAILFRPDGTAVIECYTPVKRDLSAYGGSEDATVLDSEIQQIDIATGKLLFDWHSIDHLPVTDTYATLTRSTIDYMHTNAISAYPGHPDEVVISARHLSQVFSLNLKTGKIGWRVGGRHPTLKLSSGAVDTVSAAGHRLPFSFQHDAQMQSDTTLTVFDNGNQRSRPPYSRAASFTLNPAAHTVTEINSAAIRHSPDIFGSAHGSNQKLPDGHTLISWGTTGRATEYDAHKHVVEEITSTDSYRLLRQVWHATPADPPSIAASTAGGRTTVYASWNGATDVASWRVLAGSSPDKLRPVTTAKRAGFETTVTIPAAADVRLQARNSAGKVIGTSVVAATQK